MDDDLIVVTNPTGLLTIPDGYNPNLPSLSVCWKKNYKGIVVHRLKRNDGVVLNCTLSHCHKF